MSIWILIVIVLLVICSVGTGLLVRGISRPPRKTYETVLQRGEPTNPGQLGFKAKEVEFALHDNVLTPGWIIKGKKEDAPIILIIHGFGDSRFGAMLWASLVNKYASHIVVFDMPGHGDSKAKNCGGGLREPKDVLKIIAQVPTLTNNNVAGKKIVLYGYSLGAQTAIAAAALGATTSSVMPIAGVIADGPYQHWDEPVKNMLRLRRWPRQPFVFITWLLFYIFSKEFRNFDRAKKAEQLNCPLLVLHGTDDELCPHKSGRQIAEAAKNGTFVSFEYAHHLDLIELYPRRYENSIKQFFENLAK